MDHSFQDLLEHLHALPKLDEQTCLIGISGFGGSGKSTLAKGLAEVLPNTRVVAMDDFWLHSTDVPIILPNTARTCGPTLSIRPEAPLVLSNFVYPHAFAG